MTYFTKLQGEAPVQHRDMESAIEFISSNPNCSVRKEDAGFWVRGTSFAEYGDAAFDDPRLATEQIHKAHEVLLTTETILTLPISERLGIVASQAVMGIEFTKEFLIGWRDTFGGRSKTLEKQFQAARETALREIREQAILRRANAVIAISFAYANLGNNEQALILVSATGTAVRFAQE